MTTQVPERVTPPNEAVAKRAPAPPPNVPKEPRRQALKYWIAERRLAVSAWALIAVICISGVGLYFAGALDPLRIKQPATTFGSKGANLVERGAFGPDIDVGVVGKGLDTTYIIRAKGLTGPQPAVIFLHGFGSSLVVGYEAWLEHLARQGMTVIFPSWQQAPYPTDGSQNPRVNMFRGVRLAVKAMPIQEDKVAVMGFSAGGALAYDYAALAKEIDVPKARLVFSVYPGRAFPGEEKAMLPLPPAGGMEPDTKVVILVSRKDEEAGTRWGVDQYRQLKDRPRELRELVYVTRPGLTDHYAPGDVSRKARQVFWQPFDRLLTEHLGVQRLPDRSLRRAIKQTHYMEEALKEESLTKKRAQRGESSVIDGGASTTEVVGAKPKLPN